LEAEPLVDLSTSREAADYLLDQHVSYVVIPSWAVDRVTEPPNARVLPLFGFLGSTRFPVLTSFSVRGNPIESTVYAVSSGGERRSVS
jgi:hypothetical protein